jgi:hypothetical protein
MKETFKKGLFSSCKWCHLIVNTLVNVLVNGDGKYEEWSKEESADNDKGNFHKASFANEDMDVEDNIKLDFGWLDDISKLGGGTE